MHASTKQHEKEAYAKQGGLLTLSALERASRLRLRVDQRVRLRQVDDASAAGCLESHDTELKPVELPRMALHLLALSVRMTAVALRVSHLAKAP